MQAEFEKPTGNEPVYLQIVNQVRCQLAAGRLSPGEPLPSRRELAMTLEINPNTVQKAYKILEEQGILSTAQSSHSVISASDEQIAEIRRSLARDAAREFAAKARSLGLDFREAMRVLGDEWE